MTKLILYHDPTLRHLTGWFAPFVIACVFAGVALAELFPDFAHDQYLRQRRQRPARVYRLLRAPRLTAKRKAA